MAPDNDIRNAYSTVKDAAFVRHFLCTQLPLPTSEKDARFETSGFDCLVTIIRLIYANFATGIQGVQNMKSLWPQEDKNPILRYAWQSLERTGEESDETKEAWGRDKLATVTKLLGGETLSPGQTCFESLCAGRRMNETLWSHECFWFFKDIVRINADDCVSVPWDRTDLAIASQLEFDGNQIPTLQEAVEMRLGPRKTDRGEEIYMAEPPCFVRIRYTPSTLEPLPFSRLQCLEIPVGMVEQGTRLRYRDNVRRYNYCVMAVVRMRKNPGERDHVRTYWGNAARKHIRLARACPEDDWSVQDGDHTYMLFYRYWPQPVIWDAAEVEPEEDDVHVRETLDLVERELDRFKESTVPSSMGSDGQDMAGPRG